jgi:hypothetical protein
MAKTPKVIVKTEEVAKPKRIRKKVEVNPYNVEPTAPVVKRRSNKKKVEVQPLVDLQTTDVVVSLPEDVLVKEENNAVRGVLVANVIIALLVGLGILVWNYNNNWDKPVQKVEGNPFSVAKSAPEKFVTTIPATVQRGSVTITPPIVIDDKPSPNNPALADIAEVKRPNPNLAFLPNSTLTPGAVDEAATKNVVCSGYAKRTRKLINQSDKLKAFTIYNIDWKTDNFEVDHLVPLGLGGSNTIENLWPQSYTTRPWNAHMKDKLETQLHSMVCAGKIELKEAQDLFKTDWIESYKKIVKE